MNFKQTIELLLQVLNKNPEKYALIGGFALGFSQVHRTTSDIDFLVDIDAVEPFTEFLTGLGYKKAFESEDVIQFSSALSPLASIDILIAHRPQAYTILSRARDEAAFGKPIRVALTEDLIGLKLQALSNPMRENLYDHADIKALIKANRASLDFTLVEPYFDLFQQQELWAHLKIEFKID